MRNATLRDHAAAALHALGSTNATCPPPGPAGVPDVAVPAPKALVTLTFVTDAGRLGLTLDPNVAPADVARIVELARSGFYDGVAIHRVVPGLVVQFGDPGGDGYGGAGRDPVPSETSPLDFEAFAVGLAESGADTGSSQIFVTVSPDPALYGDYPLLGFANPEWATVAEHDVIQRVEIRP
jgi:cyclophilin family peptidyl-prolyl cis-trans isomerase